MKGGRISHRGKIWVDTIAGGTDGLQQLRDFFITASVFDSPSLEEMLRAAAAMYFNELMALKGRRSDEDSVGYAAYTYLIKMALGSAFEHDFVSHEDPAAIKEDVDELVRDVVEGMVERVVCECELAAPVSEGAEQASRKRSADDCDADEMLDPVSKKCKEEVCADDMDVEALFTGPYECQDSDDSLVSSIFSDSHVDNESNSSSVPEDEPNTSNEHDESATASKPDHQTVERVSPPSAESGDQHTASHTTSAQSSHWYPPPGRSLCALRETYLDLIWAYRFDLLNNTQFLMYLSRNHYFSSSLMLYLAARGGLGAPRPASETSSALIDLDITSVSRGGKSRKREETSESSSRDKESMQDYLMSTLVETARHLGAQWLERLSCPGWLVWAACAEDGMSAFWAEIAALGGLDCARGVRRDGKKDVMLSGKSGAQEAPF